MEKPTLMSRAVAGHAASIGIAGALSFVFAGALGEWLGWRGAFTSRFMGSVMVTGTRTKSTSIFSGRTRVVKPSLVETSRRTVGGSTSSSPCPRSGTRPTT